MNEEAVKETDEKEKCPTCGTELVDDACPKDGCGFKKKKKTDDSAPTTTLVSRTDVYEDDWNFSFRETPEGYLMGKAVVTNIGVFPYVMADGTIQYELRPPEEVFSPESMWSLKGKPITNDHPGENVNVDNIQKYAIGKTDGDPEFDSYHLIIGLTFDNKEAIQQIRAGKRALSCGYTTELEWKSGNYLGTHYDCIQRRIRYNHISLVEEGRAGDAARIRIDSADAILVHSKEEDPMEKSLRTITLDNADYQAEDKVIEALNAARTRSDELQTKLDENDKAKSAIEAERDSLKEKVDALQKQIDAKKDSVDRSEVDKLVKARIALLDVARKAEVQVADSATDKDIMIAVIKKQAPAAKVDGASDEYIQTRYQIVVEDMETAIAQKNDAGNRELAAPDKAGRTPVCDVAASHERYAKRFLGEKVDGGK